MGISKHPHPIFVTQSVKFSDFVVAKGTIYLLNKTISDEGSSQAQISRKRAFHIGDKITAASFEFEHKKMI